MSVGQAICTSIILCLAAAAAAWHDDPPEYRRPYQGLHVVDGSYVMNVGELQVNITNHGLIGSRHSIVSTYSDAPSAQWPAGSGDEYLFAGGLWVGGVQHGEMRVTTGQFEREWRPSRDVEATIYESRDGVVLRPWPNPLAGGDRIFQESYGDDDGDGDFDEDGLNGRDDDEDGRVDEDFAHFGNQMMVCEMIDDSPLAGELYPDHRPMHLSLTQTSFAWSDDDRDDAVNFFFDVRNHGSEAVEDVSVGFFADFDIGRRDNPDAGANDMAGYWTGMVEAGSGEYVPVSVGYMYDGDPVDPLPGYIGVMFFDRSGSAPLASFQRYTGRASFAVGGDPMNDAERYQALTSEGIDFDVPEGFSADYRILCAPRGSGRLYPGQLKRFAMSLVIGDGFEGLLRACADIVVAWEGRYFDVDLDPETGIEGRETLVCLEDYPGLPFAATPIAKMVADYADPSCRPYMMNFVRETDLEVVPGRGTCIWVNMDNCDECEAAKGSPCNENDFFRYWLCGDDEMPDSWLKGCTGVKGRETVVRWLADTAPPSPNVRVWERHDAVHLYWSDESERTLDPMTGLLDFEGYRVWRADNWDRPPGSSEALGPPSSDWQLLGGFDLINDYRRVRRFGGGAVVDTMPLGDNTGIDYLAHRPACLDDPEFAGLDAVMADVVASLETPRRDRPPLRDRDGLVTSGMESLLPWEAHPAVLDTFYLAADDPRKPGVSFYEYVDRDVHDGFLYFYAVTAFDHDMEEYRGVTWITGEGLHGDPALAFTTARPRPEAQDAAARASEGHRVYVYPNPATRESLAEFQSMHPNGDDPTGVRVVFNNLPRAPSEIGIYSLNGDLVQTIVHDGSDGDGDAAWNLVSRNGQQVVSGIYLYSVRTDAPGFDDVIGKFVLVR